MLNCKYGKLFPDSGLNLPRKLVLVGLEEPEAAQRRTIC